MNTSWLTCAALAYGTYLAAGCSGSPEYVGELDPTSDGGLDAGPNSNDRTEQPTEAGADGSATSDAAQDAPSNATDQEKLICDAFASRSACTGGARVCDAQDKCIYGRVMLPAAASVYAGCRGAPSCKGDDLCVSEASSAVGGAAATQYSNDCVARRAACSNSFNDDFCASGIYAYPDAGISGHACLSKPCDEITACFKDMPALKAIAACKSL